MGQRLKGLALIPLSCPAGLWTRRCRERRIGSGRRSGGGQMVEPRIELRRTVAQKPRIGVIERPGFGEKLVAGAGGIPGRGGLPMATEPGIECGFDGRSRVFGGVTEFVQHPHGHVGQDVVRRAAPEQAGVVHVQGLEVEDGHVWG